MIDVALVQAASSGLMRGEAGGSASGLPASATLGLDSTGLVCLGSAVLEASAAFGVSAALGASAVGAAACRRCSRSLAMAA